METEKQWLSVIATGYHSDTYVFVVGVYPTQPKAVAAAEELVEKSREINRRAEEAGRQEDFDLEEDIEREHARLFGERWFPPKADWRISVAEIKGEPLRVF